MGKGGGARNMLSSKTHALEKACRTAEAGLIASASANAGAPTNNARSSAPDKGFPLQRLEWLLQYIDILVGLDQPGNAVAAGDYEGDAARVRRSATANDCSPAR